MNIPWIPVSPKAQEYHLGLIPNFLAEQQGTIKERLTAGYHSWPAMEGFTLDDATMALQYPRDPDIMPLWAGTVFPEDGTEQETALIAIYPYGIVAIIKENEISDIARLD